MSKSPKTNTRAPETPIEKLRPRPLWWQKVAFVVTAVLLVGWMIFLAVMAKK
jgi:hypothetical protein